MWLNVILKYVIEKQFNNIEEVSSVINNPFQQNLNISKISNTVSKLFNANQSEIEL